MKRTELIKQLHAIGCVMLRHGSRHDWYQNPQTRECQPVPRHREIKDQLARHIIKKLSD